MSYCEIITFKDGKPDDSLECSNAWGGAAYVWDCMFTKFLKDPNKQFDNWLASASSSGSPLWQLTKRQDIPLFMRAVHCSTYDYAIVGKKNFVAFSGHLREFVRYFGTNGKVCHLDAFAKFIDDNSEAEAVGFYGTSVSENLWLPWDGEKDECVPYDLNDETNDKHFEVYEHLEEWRLYQEQEATAAAAPARSEP